MIYYAWQAAVFTTSYGLFMAVFLAIIWQLRKFACKALDLDCDANSPLELNANITIQNLTNIKHGTPSEKKDE